MSFQQDSIVAQLTLYADNLMGFQKDRRFPLFSAALQCQNKTFDGAKTLLD